MSVQDIKMVTFNVKGISSPVKRSKILSKVKRENAQIVLLQETHLTAIEHEKLKRMGYSRAYYSSYKNGRRRGVIILISQKIAFNFVSEQSDKEGRYIIVSGRIDNTVVSICNIYAPPGSDFTFYRKVLDLMTGAPGIVICGGDWNLRLNPNMDSSKNIPKVAAHEKVNNLITELGILDLWRDFNPLNRDYTFYSHPHDTYSRIDYFFVFKRDRFRFSNCTIGSIDLSDHAPVFCTFHMNNTPRSTLWRLNSSALNNPQFVSQIKEEIKTFLDINDTGEIDSSMIWDTLKAVLRGRIISWCAYNKKMKQLESLNLDKKLKELELQHKKKQCPSLLNEIKKTQNKINILYTQEVEKKFVFVKQKYYETGPKASKILARRLQKERNENTIFRIKDPDSGELLYSQEQLQRTFEKYYKTLYTQLPVEDAQQMDVFLTSLNLPTLSEEQNDILTAEITERELKGAISRLKPNKTPGPDGYSSEWYKVFSNELLPSLLKSFNSVLKDFKMPPSWREAIISVIPKEGKDKTVCGSYRPISVLNVDYKLFTAILAKRLEKMLPQLIHTDQTGFVLQRQTHDNIRRSLHILHHIHKNKLEALLVSLDAEKAFDSVSWAFLYKVLEQMRFHKNFVEIIRTLYSAPSARVKINGHLTDPITLQRGSRQGCPISPLLFCLYIEPLAQWLRQTKSIKGVSINGDEHKTALYADDVLVYVTDPTNSFPQLINVLQKFGQYSGYKLNIDKTQIITLNYTPPKPLCDSLPLKWNQQSLKYLGINIPKDLSKLVEINFLPLLTKIKEDIKRWNLISFLSLNDRIESVKMNILPRYLFLFQTLPVNIPPKDFSELNKIISRFIWQGKKPRVRYKTLQIPKNEGGMALPCFKTYFFAAQIKPILNMCAAKFQARWKDIEISEMKDPPIYAILAHTNLDKCINSIQNPWIIAQLKTWNKVKGEFKLDDKIQILQWCAFDPGFKPNLIDTTFKQWISKGITAFYTLLQNGKFKDFDSCKTDFGLTNADFFRYLQLRNYFQQQIISRTDFGDPVLGLFLMAYKNTLVKGAIGKLYKGLMTKKDNSTYHIKEKWEKEGNFIISNDEWLNACKSARKTTSSNKWREFGWKCLIRFFITPKQKVHFTGGPADCWRLCGTRDAGHWHIFWDCSKIKPFWVEVHKAIVAILNIKIPLQPHTLFFENCNNLSRIQNKYLFSILLTAAKKAITRCWLLPDPPTVSQWNTIIREMYTMEAITFSLKLKKSVFVHLWSGWVKYIKPLQQDFVEISCT